MFRPTEENSLTSRRLWIQAAAYIILSIMLATLMSSTMNVNAQPQPPPAIRAYWIPTPAMPNDTVEVQANVTSLVGIRNVTIYYQIGPKGLRLGSSSDYNNSLMKGPMSGNYRNDSGFKRYVHR
jgi:uncharacterized lipoprotein YddW (UPF0748 family)